MSKPLLSIVIANYNYGRFLEEAILSVLSQGMGDKVELIICDARSTDNSVDIIKKYANGLPPNTSLYDWQPFNTITTNNRPQTTNISWWCSEPDGGQSAAFNKGFSNAKGKWLTWLNADDFYFDGALRDFEKLLNQHPNAKWITSNKVAIESATHKIIRVSWGPHLQPPFLNKEKAFVADYGVSAFIRRDVYENVGPIDEKLHYAMDTDYWHRLTMAGIRETRFNRLCWAFRVHEDSKTAGLQTDEITLVRKKETQYWMEKTGYCFQAKLTNIWYLLWILWRFIDFSWIMRGIMKRKYEGKSLDQMFPRIQLEGSQKAAEMPA